MTSNARLRNGSRKEMRIVMGVFAVLVTAIIVVSYSNSVFAAGNMQNSQMENILRGEIVAVDNLHHSMRMLTLRSEGIGDFPNDSLNIFLGPSTTVKICSEREPSRDINVGRNATVTYHEVRGWLPVADAVSEHC
jgi:hypothetical protein